MTSGKIILRRLFDQNMICLNSNGKLKSNYRELGHPDKFFKDYIFFEADKEKDFKRELYFGEEHTFVVKYAIE